MKSESLGVGPKQQHLKSFYLFIFGCAVSSLPLGHFSSCGMLGLLSSCGAWISHAGGFSRGAGALGRVGFSSCNAQTQSLQLPGCRGQVL